MPDVDALAWVTALALAFAGLVVLLLGIRMFRDGKGPDAGPQALAGAALVAAAASLPFALEEVAGAVGALDGLASAEAAVITFAAAMAVFAGANAALSLRLILLERRRDGVLFLVAGVAAAGLAVLLILTLAGVSGAGGGA